MNEIIYPAKVTYFIAAHAGTYSVGTVAPNQCMGTGLENLETFDSEDAYAQRLEQLALPTEEDLDVV
jgi:hypothetical protein